MPINNSYSQTPKRIFTNKPFIKGMNYTNADLEPFVCRAVSNLELESSNSATKLRPGINNTAIGEEGEIAYRFYNKYIMFSNVINELNYNNDIFENISFNGIGIKVLDNSYSVIPLFETIITNNTELEYNNGLVISGGESGINITNDLQIIALQMNEGDIPHCINNEDFSFVFLGFIMSNGNILYKGLIKLYHHKVANKIIIEIIKPEQVDNNDVSDYGLNLLSNSPSIYKDYIPFVEHDFYNDYMGTDKSKEVKNTIDLLTVALYDSPVNPAPFVNTSTAKMLKGVNSSAPTSSTVYIRPYYVMPYGHYGAIIKASNKTGSEVYYNFSNKTFGLSANVTKVVKETKTISIPVYSNSASSENTYTGVLDEDSVVIESCYIPSFNLLAYDTDYTYYDVAMPPSEQLTAGHNTYHIGFNKQSYAININKYSIDLRRNDNVLDNAMQFSDTDIDADERIEIRLDKCEQLSLALTMSCTCNQYYRCTNDDALIYPVNSNSVKSYYSFEATYQNYSNGKYSTALHTIMHAHFTAEVYVYSRFNNMDYSASCEISNVSSEFTLLGASPTGLSFMPYTLLNCTFNKITSNPAISITSSDMPSVTLSDNSIMYCKKYTISTTVDYEANTGDFVDGAINSYANKPGLHITNDATDVQADTDYVYFTKKQGNHEDKYVVPKDNVLTSETQASHLPMLTFNFNITYNNSFNPVYKRSTDNSYDGASPAQLELTTKISTMLLNEINDNDNSLGYTILQSIVCRQSPNIEYITDSITVDNSITYNYNTDFTSLNAFQVASFVDNAVANTHAFVNAELRTSKESAHISKNYVHIVQDMKNNRNFSIPIASSAFNSITGSSIVVRLFPIINVHTDITDDSEYIEYKEVNVVEQPLYSIRTDLDSSVDLSELINDKFKTTALRMCNHLGHLVVWGDETNTNSLYYSAYGNISYFPSNYIITFDNPVVYAYPHKGNLVVFTTEDIYLLFNGNVPSTTTTDGSEVGFTQKLIQANTRLGKEHINTVRAVGKDLFFINSNNKGYLLRTNKYVNDESDVYLVKLTTQIDDLLDNPYDFANERFNKWNTSALLTRDKGEFSDMLPYMQNVTYYIKSNDHYSYVYYWDISSVNSSDIRVIDGDTIEIDETSYRLADIDTPEITKEYVNNPQRLGLLAKGLLEFYIDGTLTILHTGDYDNYGRELIYLIKWINNDTYIDINATLLYNGLADFFDEDHDSPTQFYRTHHRIAYNQAKLYKRGIHNNVNYDEEEILVRIESDYIVKSWNTDSKLYTYANNSYIYIIQPVHLGMSKAITLIYKYSIDSKIWTMYDVLGYINPTDIISTNNVLGFSILNLNDDTSYIPSVLDFTKNKYDINNVIFNMDPDNYNMHSVSKIETPNKFIINTYFDSGNQSISLMNDKLFREIKLSLGALPDSLLSMDYQIDFYVDGKLIIPNQLASCEKHIHQVPVNQHYKGREENLEGFQKITFFAPARGRIPRIVFSINAETDINILEYALVYMQLNAK